MTTPISKEQAIRDLETLRTVSHREGLDIIAVWAKDDVLRKIAALPVLPEPPERSKFHVGETVLHYGVPMEIEVVMFAVHCSEPLYELVDHGDENQRHFDVLESKLSPVLSSEQGEGT